MQQTLNNTGVNSLTLPKLLISMLGSRLSEHLKRIIFVFSVYAVIDKRKGSNQAIICDLNNTLKLAKNAEICFTSAKAHNDIWCHTRMSGSTYSELPVLKASTSRVERDMIAQYYLRNCPDWLRYGDENGCDMRRDLQRLFSAIVTKDA